MQTITRKIAKKVLKTVDCGLSNGLGNQKPGEMCVEAAVCHALGLPHGDDPGCVSPALRRLKIVLNDSAWSSKAARAKGLRRLALAQLGSKDVLDEKEFVWRCAVHCISVLLPQTLRNVGTLIPSHAQQLNVEADKCSKISAWSAARSAESAARSAASSAASSAAWSAAWSAASSAAWSAARDKVLSDFAETIVQILIDLKTPGCKWLYLTEK